MVGVEKTGDVNAALSAAGRHRLARVWASVFAAMRKTLGLGLLEAALDRQGLAECFIHRANPI